jgi:hypothetical protein
MKVPGARFATLLEKSVNWEVRAGLDSGGPVAVEYCRLHL